MRANYQKTRNCHNKKTRNCHNKNFLGRIYGQAQLLFDIS